jgi:hypothetical protein
MDRPVDLDLITSALFDQVGSVRFGMSTRTGGASPEPLGMNLSYRVTDAEEHVRENRSRFFGHFGFDPTAAAVPHQCHSSRVLVVSRAGEYESCDGLITTVIDLPLVVTVADCLPVVLVDPVKRVLGVVHAGWRGTAEGIVASAIDVMIHQCGAAADRMIAYLGPSAGVCCYEVGREVAEAFASDKVELREGRLYLDLRNANLDQMLAEGIVKQNVEVSAHCTICRPDLFHSYRRDKHRSGRMMALAVLTDNRTR